MLESSVRSSLLPFLGKTGTGTSPSKSKTFKKPDWTNEDRSRLVFCSFFRSWDWSEPVTVQTGYKPVQTGPNLQIYYINSINYITWIYYIIILFIIKALWLAFQAREGLCRIETREGGVVVDGQPLCLTFRAREGWWWPPSCWNMRWRGCGGWTSSVLRFEQGRVVVRVSGGGDQQQTMLLITIKSIKLIELK